MISNLKEDKVVEQSVIQLMQHVQDWLTMNCCGKQGYCCSNLGLNWKRKVTPPASQRLTIEAIDRSHMIHNELITTKENRKIEKLRHPAS